MDELDGRVRCDEMVVVDEDGSERCRVCVDIGEVGVIKL